jgi:uncharacterized protein DUF4386
MTRPATARIAGFTFLFYILVAFPMSRGDVRISIILTLLSCFCAVVLAVTLYGITRDVDHELAIAVLAFRVVEAALGAGGIPDMQASLPAQNTMLGAPFFAIGSLIFSYLLLKGRLVPEALAWVGIVASALLVVSLPLQVGGYLSGVFTSVMWLPMLAFEVPLGLWLMIKGVAAPVTAAPPRRWG